MTRPREVLRNQFYLLTRRCANQWFLLRPDAATNNAYAYCLAVAAQRCGMEVVHTVAESNHHHTTIYDRDGRCPEFITYFHSLVARSQNALRGRWENFWAAGEPCVTRLLDRETVIAKVVYSVANPVKDRLVERVHHWPGVNTYTNLVSGRALRATRPRHFFRDPGPLPEKIELRMTIPAELGPADAFIAEVRAGVERVEREVAETRRDTGASVLGRRRILEQRWDEAPTTFAPRRNLRPRFAGRTEARIDALGKYRAFLAAYRFALVVWRTRVVSLFPCGTYWLARFAGVATEPVPL